MRRCVTRVVVCCAAHSLARLFTPSQLKLVRRAKVFGVNWRDYRVVFQSASIRCGLENLSKTVAEKKVLVVNWKVYPSQ